MSRKLICLNNKLAKQKIVKYATAQKSQLLERFSNSRGKKLNISIDLDDLKFDAASCKNGATQVYFPCVNELKEVIGHFFFTLKLTDNTVDTEDVIKIFSGEKGLKVNYYIQPGHGFIGD